MKNRDPKNIIQEFRLRQTRQILAITATLFLVSLCAVLYKRPILFGDFSKATLFGAQVVSIAAFMGFTAVNWRCPSCKKSLGNDIHRKICRHCGAKLR